MVISISPPPSPTAMTESPASSAPTTPHFLSRANSPFEAFEDRFIPLPTDPTTIKTNHKTKSIFLALGALFLIATLSIGTVLTAGLLPLAAIISGATVLGVIALVLAVSSVKFAYQTDQVDPFSAANPLPALQLRNLQSPVELETAVDLCERFGQKKEHLSPTFLRDCLRDRASLEIEGLSLADRFDDEIAHLQTLKNTAEILQMELNPDSSAEQIASSEIADLALENFEQQLQQKFSDEFSRIVNERYKEIPVSSLVSSQGMATAISTIFCQNGAKMLEVKATELSRQQFQGTFIRGLDDPKSENRYELQFPQKERVFAQITIHSKALYSLFANEGVEPQKLTTPIIYRGGATISIGFDGKASIQSQVSWVSASKATSVKQDCLETLARLRKDFNLLEEETSNELTDLFSGWNGRHISEGFISQFVSELPKL